MKKAFTNCNKFLIVLTFIFVIFGLIMILSASSMESYMRYNQSPYYYFFKQLIFVGAGFVIFLIVSCLPTKIYKKLSIPLYIIIIGLLGVLLGYGYVAKNAASWFKIGSFSVQPSEFAKILTILFLSIYYDKHKDDLNNFKTLIIPFIFVFVVVVLVALQPDLGTALIITMIGLFMFLAVPMGKKIKAKIILAGVVGIAGIVLLFVVTGGSFLKDYQKQRLTEFLNPCDRYQEKSGYQVCNSFIAFTNGGIKGQGIGMSTQKYLYLPESYTDFIFPIIVEEWGGIVGGVVLVMYFILIMLIIRIANLSTNLKNSLIAYGVGIYIFIHILVNLVGVMGLAPLTGVPLPFLSYGGSYTISLFIAIALVERVAIETNYEKKKKLKVK